MALMSAYLVTTKNAAAFFNAIQGAKAPERFTTKFLKDLDFGSSNDRLFIGVLKGLGFLDENGAPSEKVTPFRSCITTLRPSGEARQLSASAGSTVSVMRSTRTSVAWVSRENRSTGAVASK